MKKIISLVSMIGFIFFALPALAEMPSPQVSISGVGILQKGKEQQLVLHLSKGDLSPMTFADLKEVHTQKIHLLLIDDSMTDYQHIHPVAGKAAGEYLFPFAPVTAHNYTLWADITPVSGEHYYLNVPLKGAAPCTNCIDKTVSLEGVDQGLKGVLTFDDPLKVGEADMGTLVISDAKTGKPVTDLEPVMGAFAHVVGFYTEHSGVAHIHPMGDEPKNDQERGGPELMIHLEPAYAGTMKLFGQVKRGGKNIFIPFTVQIAAH